MESNQFKKNIENEGYPLAYSGQISRHLDGQT